MMDNVKTTLITGGTGIIGGEMILRLAALGHSITALVRGENDEQAKQRLFARLGKSQFFNNQLLDNVQVIAGNVKEAYFGLQNRRDHPFSKIIHCAADTSFKNSQTVWDTNVGAAENLIQLASNMAISPPVYFVSTTSVITSPEHTEIDENFPHAGYENVYVKSKRHAEKLLQSSGLDLVIIRPSIVLSRGIQDPRMAQSILWIVPIISELKKVPVDPHAKIDLVPVDFVAEAITRLVTKPSLKYRCYHVSAGAKSKTFGELRESLLDKFSWVQNINFLGGRFSSQSANAVQKRLLKSVDIYLPFINADVTYACQRLFEELADNPLDCPPVTDYLPDLLEQFSLKDAYSEMENP